MQLPNRRQMDSPAAHTCRSISDFELKNGSPPAAAAATAAAVGLRLRTQVCVFGESAGRESKRELLFRARVLMLMSRLSSTHYLPNEIDTVLRWAAMAQFIERCGSFCFVYFSIILQCAVF